MKALNSATLMCAASAAAAKALASSMGDYFKLLGLEPGFELDVQLLGENYRQAARLVHPDRFASADAARQRQALEQAAELNLAYDTLKHATSRALYLLNRAQPLDEESTVQDPEFLFQQMQWREELEELEDFAAIAKFTRRLNAGRAQIDKQFAACWADSSQREQAERLLRRMQFLDKLLYEVRQLEERLDDY